MSSTNKTTNYNLSQFLGSDKPAWLADYNQDMSKIDAQMKLNADSATGADGKADANAAKIGDITALTTTDKTSTVAAINEVKGVADTAQNTANSANSAAATANTGVADIASYLNINTFNSYGSSDLNFSGSGSIRNAGVTVARNTAGTLGKVYGNVIVDSVAGQSFTVTIPGSGFVTDSEINVRNAGFITLERTAAQGGGVQNVDVLSYKIGTNGSVSVTITPSTGVTVLRFVACLIFVKNFGD